MRLSMAVVGITMLLGPSLLQPCDAVSALAFHHTPSSAQVSSRQPAYCRAAGRRAVAVTGGLQTGRGLAVRQPLSLSASLEGANVEVVETRDDYEIRKASFRVGGLGRSFLRSKDVLELLNATRQNELEQQVLIPLEKVLTEMSPMEQQLAEATKKYDETESEVFGSLIRPLQVKLKPLQESREILEKDKLRGEKVMGAIQEALERSEERYVSEGVHDVLIGGIQDPVQMQAGRNVGLGLNSEISWTLDRSEKQGVSVSGKWKNNPQFPDQPLVVDLHGLTPFSGGPRQGLVLSLAPPDEGVKKLCAVAEWKGAIDSQDVTKRLEQLMIKCYMDGLIPRKDQGLGPRLTTTCDKIAMLRKNELWLPVKPPRGKQWLDHLTKVCTNVPAKNATFYSLKDSPYTWYSPWADLNFNSNLRERAGETLKPRVDFEKTLDWQLGSNMLDPNTIQLCVPIESKDVVAVDVSHAGEVAFSKLPLQHKDNGDEEEKGIYAVGYIQEWPLTNDVVARARKKVVDSLQDSGYGAPNTATFRLIIPAEGNAEVWISILRQ